MCLKISLPHALCDIGPNAGCSGQRSDGGLGSRSARRCVMNSRLLGLEIGRRRSARAAQAPSARSSETAARRESAASAGNTGSAASSASTGKLAGRHPHRVVEMRHHLRRGELAPARRGVGRQPVDAAADVVARGRNPRTLASVDSCLADRSRARPLRYPNVPCAGPMQEEDQARRTAR